MRFKSIWYVCDKCACADTYMHSSSSVKQAKKLATELDWKIYGKNALCPNCKQIKEEKK